MSLVLEEASEGLLKTLLLRDQRGLYSIILLFRYVASALYFLHSINTVFQDFKVDNVLLWSLSPDHLIYCKVADFSIITHI